MKDFFCTTDSDTEYCIAYTLDTMVIAKRNRTKSSTYQAISYVLKPETKIKQMKNTYSAVELLTKNKYVHFCDASNLSNVYGIVLSSFINEPVAQAPPCFPA